jgi:hypothetical protein
MGSGPGPSFAVERLWITAGNCVEEYRRANHIDPGVEPWAELTDTATGLPTPYPATAPAIGSGPTQRRPQTYPRRAQPAPLTVGLSVIP